MRVYQLSLRFCGYVVLLLVFFAVIGLNSTPLAAKETIKIGGLLPFTGGASVYGQYAREGIVVAVDEINAKGGIKGAKLKIIWEDHQSNVRAAVNGFLKLIQINKVPAIISENSSPVLACVPIAEEKETVIVNVGAVSPRLVGAGKYLFSNIPNGILEVDVMADYAFNELGYRTMALLHPKDDFGTEVCNRMAKVWEKKGGKIIAREPFELNSVEHRTQLSKIKAASPDCIYCLAYGKEQGVVLKEAAELGIKIPILGSSPFEMPDVIKIAGIAAEGTIYTTPSFDPKSDYPITVNFVNLFKKKHGKLPEQFAGTAYDAVYILQKAIEKIMESGKEVSGSNIRQAINEIKEFDGVSGRFIMQDDGTVLKPMNIKTYKNGEFQLIKVVRF